ncbi:quinone oxidoreductase family protein [Xanthomonas pisi]|uniref:Quinone oxidoreductase n=1 Tax=Xanthomonas pisi TaxID=56457 RepID=A0A2S7CYM3_9XANT|nr:NADPH:quinone oxidoreductase family protein [Xanthomonas pisi]KLD69518.1 quinone oxidoreductase [Xanthomonas pisi DSM 18956]PPU66569.1 quinone oxidoreductase [Xanthomonas pisi]
MKAVRFHQTGDADVLIYEDVPDPTPQDHEVLIRIEATGLNFADVMRRRGDDYPEPSPAPFILGAEVAGTIVAVGKAVTSLQAGMSVLATPGAGGYAQYICVPEAIVVPLPDGVPAVQAAAVMANGLTAALVLRNAARLAPGETVLIEGAAGGLGSLAIQLAKLYGAGKVIAAASTQEKRDMAIRLGADAAVDYTAPDWAKQVRALTDGKGVDVIVEIAGGDNVAEAFKALASFGRLIFVGQSSGNTALIDPWQLIVPNHTLTSFYVGAYLAFPQLIQSTLTEIMGLILSGQLALQVNTVLPLSQAAQAHRLLESRQTTGKVVLQPWVDA